MRTGTIITITALAAVAAAAWWAIRPGAPVTHEQAVSTGGGQEAPDHASAPPIPETITRRDHALDRAFTASQDAFRLYSEGMSIRQGRPAEAMARFENAGRLDPDFAPAHYQAAWMAVLLSAEMGGRESIRAARDAGQRLPEPYRTTSGPLSHFVNGSFDLASAALKDALEAQPEDAGGHLLAGLLGACSCDHFDPQRAAEHLEGAMRADPEIPAVRSILIDLEGGLGRPERAIGLARAALEMSPGDPDAHAAMGRARIWAGRIVEALSSADEVLRHGGDAMAAGLGPAFVLHGDHDDVRALDDPDLDPGRSTDGRIRAYLAGGINDVWQGRFADAAQRFERGAEYARAPWRRADAARFYLLQGRARTTSGRHAEAIASFHAAQRIGGSQAVLEYALGMAALAAGHHEEAARSAYRLRHELHRHRSGWTEPWRLLLEGEMALAGGDAAAAAPLIDEAWKIAAANPLDCIAGRVDSYFLDAAGRAALAAGRPHDALGSFNRIRSLGALGFHQPEIAVMAMYRSARALEDLGRGGEAADRYREFLARWQRADAPPPESRDAAGRLARLTRPAP